MLNGGLFYDYYQTSDDRYISIGSLEPNFAMSLLIVLELTDLKNKIADQSEQSQQEIRSAIADKISTQPLSYWQAEFEQVDACVEPVLTMNEAANHPHFIARGMIAEAQDASGNSIQQINSALPFKSESVHQAGKNLGADTQAVLRKLGYSGDQIDELNCF